ncbi:hypothetical protein ABMB44_05675 [Levilactobacillus brevis]
MEYNSKSLTREGATMLALADKEEKALIIDEVIVSEKVITAGNDISTLTMADFTSPLTYGISSKVQSDNQFSVKSVITNHWQDSANTDHTTNKDFNVALVGVAAHVDGYVDQHVLTVAVGNDPFVLPAYQGTDVSFVFGITQAYSASQNVTIKMDGSVYALATDLDDVKNLQGSIGIAIDDKLKDYAKKDEVQNLIPDDIATTKNVADGDAETLTSAKEYADTQVSGKADDSTVVHTADMRKPANDVVGLEDITQKALPDGTDLYTLINTAGMPLQYFASAYTHAQTMINKPTSALSTFILITSSVNNRTTTSYNYTFLNLRDVSTGDSYEALINTDGTGKVTVTRPWHKLADDSKVVHNSGNGTVTVDGRKFVPADTDHTIPVSEAGVAGPANFAAGTLKVDDLEVLGAKVFSDTEDYKTFAAAHPSAITIVTHDTSTS